jgi:hypothetical protein
MRCLQAVAALGLFAVLSRRYSISFKGKEALTSAAKFLGPTGEFWHLSSPELSTELHTLVSCRQHMRHANLRVMCQSRALTVLVTELSWMAEVNY